jgi:hypothetical protein
MDLEHPSFKTKHSVEIKVYTSVLLTTANCVTTTECEYLQPWRAGLGALTSLSHCLTYVTVAERTYGTEREKKELFSLHAFEHCANVTSVFCS